MTKVQITRKEMTPEQKSDMLQWIAFGYSVQDAQDKCKVTFANYDFTCNVDKVFSQAVSNAMRARGPVPLHKLQKFDTQSDRKQTHIELRDLYRIDEKIGRMVASLDPFDEKDQIKLVKLAHSRWAAQDKNIHQENTHRFEDIQAFNSKVDDIAVMLEKANGTLAELQKQRIGVAAKARERLGDPAFEALMDKDVKASE